MNELRKFLLGTGSATKLKPICQKCVENVVSKSDAAGGIHKLISERFNNRLQFVTRNVVRHLDILSEMVSKQCNVVLSQRVRRTYQMLLLYRNIYGEQMLKEKVCTQINKIKKKPLVALLSAAAFSWDKERVSDAEIKRCYKEVVEVHKLLSKSEIQKKAAGSSENANSNSQEWEQIVDKGTFKVWRRQKPNSELYQYRVLGHFKDIPARAFFNTQVDVHYWKDWDSQTMDVRVVDKDDQSGSEVIHWLYSFPYPMYPREYVYVRRCMVYPEKNSMIITARATKHPKCPPCNKCVRIETYLSQMVITPYTSFDQNGFSYVMSYCDDPKTNFSPVWYNWVASSGVHDFLQRLHKAALKKHEKGTELTSNRGDSSSPIYSGGGQDWRSIFRTLFGSWSED